MLSIQILPTALNLILFLIKICAFGWSLAITTSTAILNSPKARFSRLEVDTLRGLALIAVVWHHAVLWLMGALEADNLNTTVMHTTVDGLAQFLEPLRMPLFTILSGWVYALKPVNAQNTRPFVHGKLRRIIFPLIFLSTLQYFQLYFFHDALPVLSFRGQAWDVFPDEFWILWFFHFGHLWFLQAIFTIFIVMMLIDRYGWMANVKHWIIWLLLFSILPYVIRGNSFWSADKTISLAVYFFFGVGLYRFWSVMCSPLAIKVARVVFIVSMFVLMLWKLDMVQLSRLGARPFLILAGTCGALFLLSLRLKLAWLAWLGSYSYTVYLYHGLAFEMHLFFDDLLYWGVVGRFFWFGMILLMGLLIPVVIDRLIRSVPIIRTPVLGKRAFPR